jgi:hypothetical protein
MDHIDLDFRSEEIIFVDGESYCVTCYYKKFTECVELEGEQLSTAIEGHCPVHGEKMFVNAFAGTEEWLENMGHEGGMVWPKGGSDVGMIEYECNEGCTLYVYQSRTGDWTGNGTIIKEHMDG